MTRRIATLAVPANYSPEDTLRTVKRYLPTNYTADLILYGGATIIIHGEDVAGWTMDDYVLPRLASGMFYATEYVRA